MEDLVLSVPLKDATFIETLASRMGWTMRRRGHNVSATSDRRASAMLFVKSLSVQGEQSIPSDERGIDALISEKYEK